MERIRTWLVETFTMSAIGVRVPEKLLTLS